MADGGATGASFGADRLLSPAGHPSGSLFRGRWSLSAYLLPRSDSYRAESHIARRKRGSPQAEGVTLPG